MNRLFGILLSVLFLQPAALPADDDGRQSLFRIERNKNANVVQYDVIVDSDGKLNRKQPVAAYWIRLAEQGQKEELSWIQRTFAYGVDAKLGPDRESVVLKLKADIGRTIEVRRVDGEYRAFAMVEGEQAYVERIFIHATGKGMSTQVTYIDLYGNGVDDGSDLFERVTP